MRAIGHEVGTDAAKYEFKLACKHISSFHAIELQLCVCSVTFGSRNIRSEQPVPSQSTDAVRNASWHEVSLLEELLPAAGPSSKCISLLELLTVMISTVQVD